MILLIWTNRIKRRNVLKLPVATNLPLLLDGLVLQYHSLNKLSSRKWYEVVSHPALEIPLGVSITDRFNCGIFLLKRKLVFWHPQTVAILALKQTPQHTRTPSTVLHSLAQAVDWKVSYDAAYNAVRITQKNVLQQITQHHVLITTKSHGLLTIEPKAMLKNGHCTFVARKIVDIDLEQTSYNLISNFYERLVRLPKSMIIALCKLPLDLIHAVSFIDQKTSSKEPPK